MISHLVFAITLQRVHCGCITSVHAFTLLDAGGIECMTCARKNVLVVWNILVVSHFLHLLFFSMIMYGFEYGAEDAYDAISGYWPTIFLSYIEHAKQFVSPLY